MQPAVFLDRDNTLILNDGDLGNPDDVKLVEGVPAGLKSLRAHGFNLVVVTNQAGVARGRFTEEDVDAVHQRIALLVDNQAHATGLIDRFYYCPYHPEATVEEYRRDHPWRKPHPGMILQAAHDMELDLPRSWAIGDQERDIAAAKAAGCRTVLVTRDAGLAQRVQPTAVAATFGEAVGVILKHAGNGATMPLPRRPSAPEPFRTATPTPAESAARTRPASGGAPDSSSDLAGVRRSLNELIDELRSDRLRRSEFTLLRMTASFCQLLAILLAMLGLLQLGNFDVFAKWMAGAGLMQLITLTLLVLDLKG